MSDKGIYTAVSGAIAQEKRLDTIANNIANVNTPAFKRDEQVFKEYLTAYEKAGDVIEVPRVPASIESFYALNGGDKSFVDAQGTTTSFRQGSLKTTHKPLDFAIEGQGLFEVETPNGVQYTRNGSFMIDSQRKLVTKEGFPVLLQAATPDQEPSTRHIRLDGNNVSVGESGNIIVDGQPVGNLSVVKVNNVDSLRKAGNSRFALKDIYGEAPTPAQGFKLHQGFLENSNVNIIREMTDMIMATRVFESTQKAIQAYDSMKDKVVNDLPRF